MYIGIDLGGTNIAVGLVDDSGKILKSDSVPTLAQRDYKDIVKDMAELTMKVVKDAGLTMDDIKAVGLGAPGAIDSKNGIVANSSNLPGFKMSPVVEEFKKYFDTPVSIENDANAAAYGEYIATGVSSPSFIFITLGTGVGGGIVIDNKIYSGFNSLGGEIGHFTMIMDGEPCGCGNKGCWETYASVTALIRQTKAAMEAHPESLMNKIAQEDGKVSGRTAFKAEAQGDKVATEVIDKYIEYVAAGIVSMINIFQPEILVIGGGISKEGDRLLTPIKAYVEKLDYNRFMKKTEIRIAKLFNDAGIIGAALSAKNK